MLEGLDRIDWSSLEHAYGPADDVPGRIRDLASDDATTRDEARSELGGNIIHQGTVYAATSPSVPFLIELLGSPAVQDKAALLVFVAALACGSSYHDAHGPLYEEMGGLFKDEMNQPEWDERVREELGWVESARLAVVAGTPVYLKLLDDPDPEIRFSAAYTLAVGSDRAAEIVPRLEERLKIEADDRVKASILLSLGHVGGADVGPVIERFLDPAQSRVVRVAAAISMARFARERTPEAAVRQLMEAIADPGPIDDVYLQLPWTDEESVVAAVSGALGRLGVLSAGATVPRMLDALDRLRGSDSGSIKIVGAILSLVFTERKEPRRASELTEFQRKVLRRLVRSDPAWVWDDAAWLLSDFGLPDSRGELKAFLKGF